ncbi:MAG: hypothetical protein Fur0026_04130 [Sideroxydans sp.]
MASRVVCASAANAFTACADFIIKRLYDSTIIEMIIALEHSDCRIGKWTGAPTRAAAIFPQIEFRGLTSGMTLG